MAKDKTDKRLREEQSFYESYYSGVVAPKEASERYKQNAEEIDRRKKKNESAASGKSRLTTDDKRL